MAGHTNNSVLITGINGFTGKHLESYLTAQGFNVYGTTFSNSEKENHVECDILDFDRLKGVIDLFRPKYIIHLAAISFVASQDLKKIYETNIFGTLNLLNAIGELNFSVEKTILASSAAVYGNIGQELSEEMCPKPINHYGNSKLAMENMASNFFSKLNLIITRPFNYTGVGQEDSFLVPKIVEHFREKKKTIELGNLHTFREYNDVGFLVRCYERLLASEFKSGVVNIASGKTHSIKKILEILKDISAHEIDVKVNELYVRKNEIRELKGSNLKLESLIGELQEEYTLRKTLKDMYLA